MLVSGAVTAGTLGVAFTLLALGVEWFWVAYPLGFGGVLPLALGALGRRRCGRTDSTVEEPETGTESALAELRQRYARGELTDAEFEQRVERLLESESVGRGDQRRR